MLQQTQAARVVAHYEAFIARFPDERALAAAPRAEVLRAWSGLGYPRRALALARAVGVVVEDGWPRTARALLALPGVGPYTAAAVASFAFGEQVAAVDTNVARVIERLDGVRRPPAALRRRAGELVPSARAPAWNQAMMELGATVCRPRRPRCESCPMAPVCRSRGRIAEAPRRRGSTRDPFESTNRYARGRVLAALVAGEGLPEDLGAERLERALVGLERDGLVTRVPGRAVALAEG